MGCLSIGENVVARNQFRVGSALASDNRGLWAVGRRIDAQRYEIEVGAGRHAHFVQIEGREFIADDQGYDIEPGGSLVVLGTSPRIPRVRVRALNSTDSIAVRFDDD